MHASFYVLKDILSLLRKIALMECSRYPRRCLEELRRLAQRSPNSRLNCFNKVRSFFIDCGLERRWIAESPLTFGDDMEDILDHYARCLKSADRERILFSKSLLIYSNLQLVNGTQKYVLFKCPLRFKRVIAQIRLLNLHVSRIVDDGCKYVFDKDHECFF